VGDWVPGGSIGDYQVEVMNFPKYGHTFIGERVFIAAINDHVEHISRQRA
jgi:hypothetical protein